MEQLRDLIINLQNNLHSKEIELSKTKEIISKKDEEINHLIEEKKNEIIKSQKELQNIQELHKKEIANSVQEIKALQSKLEQSEKNQATIEQRNSLEITSMKLKISELETHIKELETKVQKETSAHEEKALQLEKAPDGLEDFVKRIREEFYHLVIYLKDFIVKNCEDK